MNREQVIATATRIAEIRAELGRMSALQKELRQLEASIDVLTGETTEVNTSKTVEQKVHVFVDLHQDQEWTAELIAEKVGTKVPSTRSAISKLAKNKSVIKVGRGKYRSTLGWPEAEIDKPQEELALA
jgi:hypothetical protein